MKKKSVCNFTKRGDRFVISAGAEFTITDGKLKMVMCDKYILPEQPYWSLRWKQNVVPIQEFKMILWVKDQVASSMMAMEISNQEPVFTLARELKGSISIFTCERYGFSKKEVWLFVDTAKHEMTEYYNPAQAREYALHIFGV